MGNNKLAFIGGSGIYNLDILKDIVEHDIISSFGNPSSKIIEGKINGNSIYLTGNIPIIRKLEKMFKSYEL